MKVNPPQFLALGAVLFIASITSAFAQSTWQTVDGFQLAPGKVAGVSGMAAVDNGVVFSSGGADDASGVRHGFVRRSLDAGQSWVTVLDVSGIAQFAAVTIGPSGRVHAAGPGLVSCWVTAVSEDGGTSWTVGNAWAGGGSPLAVVEDVAGRVFLGGYIIDTNNRWHFSIRRSLDGGATWATVQDLVSPSGASSVWAMAATPAGVFAAGRYGNTSWIVRRSTDGGQTWNTVDTYYSGSTGNFPYGMTADANGNLLATGVAIISPGKNKPAVAHWITRRSVNGGQTWTVVDDFAPGSFNTGRAVTVDAYGRVFATGYVSVNGVSRWITRVSLNGGTTWVTSDDVPLLSSAGTPRAAAADAIGNLFIGGQAPATDGVNHGVVRILPAP
ncbi:MAG TPA: sialidase family protein [Verrucomicrobiae bacterium]